MKPIRVAAHEWRSVPQDSGRVVCALCALVATIGAWPAQRCHPRFESAGSGFKREPDAYFQGVPVFWVEVMPS